MEKPPTEEKAGPNDVEAVGALVKALGPFNEEARQRIVDSALTLLGGGARTREAHAGLRRDSSPPPPRDILEFRGQKQPRTANEMAAVTAYYLWKVAPPDLRQDFIRSADVKKYFEEANFEQPGDPLMTLVNAKNAGYFDSLGGGKYRLNPVGLNLVTHGLGRQGENATTARTRPKRKRRQKPMKTSRKPRKR